MAVLKVAYYLKNEIDFYFGTIVYTGENTFKTLADANAASLPQWRGFRVVEDTAAINGQYYRFNGTSKKWADLAKPPTKNIDDTTGAPLEAETLKGAFLQKAGIEETSSVNLAKPEYIVQGKYVTGTGVINSSSGWVMIVIPVTPTNQYTFGNFEITSVGYSSFHDDSNAVIQTNGSFGTGTLPKTYTAPVGATKLIIDIARPSDTPADHDELIVNKGSLLLPYENPYGEITKINGRKIKGVIENPPTDDINDTTGAPITSKGVRDNVILESDLNISISLNLAKLEYVVQGKYVSGTGLINTSAGWVMIDIPITPGNQYTFGNFQISDVGYSSFHNDSNAVVQANGSFGTGTLPKTYTAPTGATRLIIDIARPANIPADHDELTVNEGGVLLPYDIPAGSITTIKGITLASSKSNGGQDYDQVLNTTDDVVFNRLSVSRLETSVLVANLPSGTAEPAGLEVNEVWIDTNSKTLKIKI